MIYVVGGRGFVGSAYVRLFERLGVDHRAISRENAADFAGSGCDILINANGNSKKFLASQDPLRDFDLSVRSVAATLSDIKAKTYVFLSTGDVYPDPSAPALTCEDAPIAIEQVSRYGLHKLLAEQLVRGTQPRWLIVRMGGFVGPGIKKNAIFDLLHSRPVWLSPASELQFIGTDRAAEIVWDLCQQDLAGEVVNLGARNLVNLGKLHGEIESESSFQPDAPTVRYELNLQKLATLYRGTLPDSRDEVQAFVGRWRSASGRGCQGGLD